MANDTTVEVDMLVEVDVGGKLLNVWALLVLSPSVKIVMDEGRLVIKFRCPNLS